MSLQPDFAQRVRVDAAVSIQSDRGGQFGTLLVMEDDRCVVELNDPLPVGVRAEFQVELRGFHGKGRCEVTAGQPMLTAADEAPRQRFRIVTVAEGDRDVWTAWRLGLLEGGTFTQFSGLTASAAFRHAPGGPTPREALRSALKKVEVPGPMDRRAEARPGERLVDVVVPGDDKS